MKPTMFVVMILTDTKYTLRRFIDLFPDAIAYAPGSLGQVVRDAAEYVIGSVGFKHESGSVLIFANGKIKLSGGTRGYTEDVPFDGWLREHRVVPLMRALGLHDVSVTLVLLNGSDVLSHVNMLTFHDTLERLSSDKTFDVTMPSVHTDPRKRGRICSVGVRVPNRKGSMRFDHSGKMQMFGFRSYEEMKTTVETLKERIRILNNHA